MPFVPLAIKYKFHLISPYPLNDTATAPLKNNGTNGITAQSEAAVGLDGFSFRCRNGKSAGYGTKGAP